jgi:RNase adaptor protein for sRNA GlmZ degradation
MLAGNSATTAARANALDLSNYYRAHNLPIVLMLDVTNGLARDREDPELVAVGRSITEPAIQRLYRTTWWRSSMSLGPRTSGWRRRRI